MGEKSSSAAFVDYLCSVFMFLSETLEQAEEGRFYDTIEQPVWKSYRKSPYNILFLFFGIDPTGSCIRTCYFEIHFTLKGTKRT